jgi:hypothetical protein
MGKASEHRIDASGGFDALELRLQDLRRSLAAPSSPPATAPSSTPATDGPLDAVVASERYDLDAPALPVTPIAVRPAGPIARRPPVWDLVLLGLAWSGLIGLLVRLAAS